MAPRFFRNMHFSMGKCIFVCFSAGCRKCIFHISLILSKNQGFHGIMHFWWFQDLSEICIFPWENAYFFAFRLAAEKIFHISLVLSKNWGFHGIMHFWWLQDFSEICIFPWENAYLFAFRLAAENAYFIFCWFCPKTKVLMELCIFDGSKICQKYAFFHGKMHICLLFGWLQKMHISYFVDFVQKPRFSWNYAFLMIPRFFRNMHFSMGKCIFFCFSAGCRKCIIPYFWKKSWSHQKCIIPWKPWFLDKINEIWHMHFLKNLGIIKKA